jgi:hypothetical protein
VLAVLARQLQPTQHSDLTTARIGPERASEPIATSHRVVVGQAYELDLGAMVEQQLRELLWWETPVRERGVAMQLETHAAL